jgi:hypothetical protein
MWGGLDPSFCGARAANGRHNRSLEHRQRVIQLDVVCGESVAHGPVHPDPALDQVQVRPQQPGLGLEQISLGLQNEIVVFAPSLYFSCSPSSLC